MILNDFILKIKEKVKKHDLFSFYHVNPDKMLKILQNIDSKKAAQQGVFNFYIDSNTFPNELKRYANADFKIGLHARLLLKTIP